MENFKHNHMDVFTDSDLQFWALHGCDLHNLDEKATLINMGDANFFQTGQPGKEFFQSASPSWVRMSAVVSPTEDSLPAAISCTRMKDRQWYFVDKDYWMRKEAKNADKHSYGGMQAVLRTMIQRIIIKTFSFLDYEYDANRGVHTIHWGGPTGLARRKVRQLCQKSVNDLDSIAGDRAQLSQLQAFLLQDVGVAVLADMIMDMTEPVLAGKNWNSHGGHLGTAICRLSTILVGFWDRENFHEFKPVALGGQRHGGTETKYVQYMCSRKESASMVCEPRNVLQSVDFFKNNRHEAVDAAFSETVGPSEPVPRPVRGHTMDFGLTCKGATLLDGECKDLTSVDGNEAAVLVLHSLDQLTWSNRAMALLTTSKEMYYYISHEGAINTKIKTNVYNFEPKYNLQHPSFFHEQDDEAEVPTFVFLNEYGQTKAYGPAATGLYSGNGELSFTDELSQWKALQPDCRNFLQHVFSVVDFMVHELSQVHHQDLEARVKEAWDQGLRDPSYASARKPREPIRTRVPVQENFIYTSKFGEAKPTAEQKLLNDLKLIQFVLDNETLRNRNTFVDLRDQKRRELANIRGGRGEGSDS